MSSGRYIKLYEKVKEWEWYGDPKAFKLFIHLLLTANWKDEKVKKQYVKRGQRLTTVRELSEETGLSVRSVRTALAKLATNELTIKTTNEFTLITIEKYEFYQGGYERSDKQNDKQPDKHIISNRTIEINNTKKVSVSNYIYKYYGYGQNVALTDEQYSHLQTNYRNTEVLLSKVSAILKRGRYEESKHFALCCKVGDEDGYRTEGKNEYLSENVRGN